MVYPNQMTDSPISRRALLAGAASASLLARPALANAKLKVAIFSKHLQFLQGEELARAAADIGFDAIDITVRKGGHVTPERVAARTAAAGGRHPPPRPRSAHDHHRHRGRRNAVRRRHAAHRRRPGHPPLPLRRLPLRSGRALPAPTRRLPRTARETGRPECTSTRPAPCTTPIPAWAWWAPPSGTCTSSCRISIPPAVGVNFDVAHATIEGGLGGWIDSFRITGPHLRGIAVKDFVWGKDAKGQWDALWRAAGPGHGALAAVLRNGGPVRFPRPAASPFRIPAGRPRRQIHPSSPP